MSLHHPVGGATSGAMGGAIGVEPCFIHYLWWLFVKDVLEYSITLFAAKN
jgi:hypothetical protein